MKYLLWGVILCLGVSGFTKAYEENGVDQDEGYGKVCTVDKSSDRTDTEFCEHGCCGDYVHRDRRCCDSGGGNTNTDTNVSVSVGVYIGAGGGGLTGLLLICACYCWCKGACRDDD